MMVLEALNQQLLEEACKGLNPDESDFILSKWPQIRSYACQNIGEKWGARVLHHPEKIKAAIHHLVKGVEVNGFTLWNPEAKDIHMEALFRLFFDDEANIFDVDFTMDEKLAIFWEYDPSIIIQFRERFEQIFSDLYQEQVWTQHDPVVTHMLISNLIALYPYFDPPEGHEVKLLQHINQEWVMVTYRIEVIPLIEDQVYAHGLIPLDHPDAYPILLFRGTPYPAARGFTEAVFSDFHPLASVGETIFKKGKRRINDWMAGKSEIKCYGISLGGALTYHMGKTYGKRVMVHAFGPPGLFPTHGGMEKIHGVAYFHADDLVKAVGYHPRGPDFKCYAVLTKANRNFFIAHNRPSGCNPTLVLEIDPKYENQKLSRHVLTAVKELISVIMYIVTLPIRIVKALINLW